MSLNTVHSIFWHLKEKILNMTTAIISSGTTLIIIVVIVVEVNMKGARYVFYLVLGSDHNSDTQSTKQPCASVYRFYLFKTECI